MTKVAVIIVTYNSARFLDGCFGTLARIDRTGLDLRVIAVDNASTDGTADLLRRYEGVEVIVQKENLGFAGGNNLAMRRAIDDGCEFVYLLNHDTEVDPQFLVEVVAVAVANPRAGAVQSLIALHPETTLVNSAGNAVHFLGLGYCLGYRRPLAEISRDGNPEITSASGAGVLLRVSALREVGLFDETLFMYHEDSDLCWRFRLAGYANILAPRSLVYHKYEFSRSIKKYYYMERNRWIVLWKNLRMWSLVVLALPMLAAEIALFLISFGGGWWREKLRVYAYFFRPSSWRAIFAARRTVQRTRKVSDREIVRLFTPVVEFQDVTGPFTERVANPLMRLCWWVLRFLIV